MSPYKPYEEIKSEQSYLFYYIFLAGLFLLLIILIGRQCFNWYIKHNAMLDELEQMRDQNFKQNIYLKNIDNNLKAIRNEISKNHSSMRQTSDRRLRQHFD